MEPADGTGLLPLNFLLLGVGPGIFSACSWLVSLPIFVRSPRSTCNQFHTGRTLSPIYTRVEGFCESGDVRGDEIPFKWDLNGAILGYLFRDRG